MGGVWVFRCSVQEQAATKVGALEARNDECKNGIERFASPRALLDQVFDLFFVVRVSPRHVRDDEVVFGSVVLVERGFGDL